MTVDLSQMSSGTLDVGRPDLTPAGCSQAAGSSTSSQVSTDGVVDEHIFIYHIGYIRPHYYAQKKIVFLILHVEVRYVCVTLACQEL